MFQPLRKPTTIVTFLLMVAVGLILLWVIDSQRATDRHLTIQVVGMEAAREIENVLDRALSPTYTLASILREYHAIDNFDKLAAEIIATHGGIDSLQLAKDGIVSHIFPLEGHETAIGHNLLKDPQRRAAAYKTIDSRKLTLAGPFELIQGGFAVIGRLPAFVVDDTGKERFWGFTASLVRISTLIKTSNLSHLSNLGYAYELRQISSETGQTETFYQSSSQKLLEKTSFPIAVPNGQWALHISSVHPPNQMFSLTGIMVVTTLALIMALLGNRAQEFQTRRVGSPQLTRWRITVTLLAVITIIMFAWIVEVIEYERINLERRSHVVDELSTVRAKLEAALNRRLFLMHGVTAFVATNPDMNVSEFQNLAGAILKNETGIRSIQLAKDTVVTHVYPLAGNEQAVGLRLLDLPLQRSAVERAIQSQSTVVAGPVNLIQGGTGFISRTPIFLAPSTEHDADSVYWGLATVLISRNSLFEEAGLFDSSTDIRIGIRGEDGLGAHGDVFFGDEELWQLQPVMLDVSLPNGSWQLAAVPTAGWDAASSRIWWLRIGGMAIASLTGILLWYLFSYQGQVEESETRFRLIINNSLDAVVSVDEEGTITDWNKQAEKMFGWSRDQALGKTLVSTIIPARYHEAHTYGMKQFLSTGKKTMLDARIELSACHQDGQEFPVEVAVIAIRIHNSYIFNASIRDITNQKQAANALQKEKELLAVTLRSIGDGVITTNTSGEIVTVNRLAEHMTGWSEQEARARPLTEVFTILDEQNREPCKNPAPKVLQTQAMVDLQENCILITRDGKERSIALSCVPINDRAHRIIGVVMAFRDITSLKLQEEQRKHLEMQLLQSQRLETVGTLAGGIAHDFNNILSPILGYAEMCLRDLPGESRIKGYVSQIIIAGKRARDLVQQILMFSCQDSLERVPIRMGSIVQESVKLMRATLPTTIHIDEDIDVESGALMANPTQIEQIVLNLMTNAYQAMPDGGTLTIQVRTVTMDVEFLLTHQNLKQTNMVKLLVSDTGQGMDLSIQPRIFEPFFTTKGPGGSGLGLSVIHGIVKEYSGAIDVSSTPNKGTTFEIYLPESTVQEIAPDQASPKLASGHETILVVDDEEVIVNMVKEMLEGHGYSVSPWTRVDEALKAFRKDPDRYHLVITDQTMPQMTGVEFSKELLAIRGDIPIILTTGFSQSVDKETALALGIVDFLRKPILFDELNASIRKILDG